MSIFTKKVSEERFINGISYYRTGREARSWLIGLAFVVALIIWGLVFIGL